MQKYREISQTINNDGSKSEKRIGKIPQKEDMFTSMRNVLKEAESRPESRVSSKSLEDPSLKLNSSSRNYRGRDHVKKTVSKVKTLKK